MAKKFGDLFGNMDDVFSGAKISNFDLDDMLSRTRTFTEEVSKKSAEASGNCGPPPFYPSAGPYSEKSQCDIMRKSVE